MDCFEHRTQFQRSPCCGRYQRSKRRKFVDGSDNQAASDMKRQTQKTEGVKEEAKEQVDILNHCTSSSGSDRAAVRNAAIVLANLAMKEENLATLIHEGVVDALVQHLQSPMQQHEKQETVPGYGHEVENYVASALELLTSNKVEYNHLARKALGLEWMVKAPPTTRIVQKEQVPDDSELEQTFPVNPKELNPYLRDGGDGYPSESTECSNLANTQVVIGDGGVSWRLKALKRAKEQAERQGLTFDKVVEERWGSLVEMTTGITGKRAAHAHAHLHAIRDRKHSTGGTNSERRSRSHTNRDYSKDLKTAEPGMKVPQVPDSLSWKGRNEQLVQVDRTDVFREAVTSLNKFKDDGSFLQSFKNSNLTNVAGTTDIQKIDEEKSSNSTRTSSPTANQLAAKSLKLRLSGKIKEEEELQKQLENINNEVPTSTQQDSDLRARYKPNVKSIIVNFQNRVQQHNSGDDRLMEGILRNRQYSLSTSVDDEYECVPSDMGDQKTRMSKRTDRETHKAIAFHKRIVTQEERCQFCFTNPSRPGHLTVSIANTCYLMLPPWEPLVEGHCLIVPMQHEGSSRNADEFVWEELRNYKKCLLKMFAGQNKVVLFMETAMHLAKQRRHCLIEAIPLSPDIAKQAPLYFKKAIDEAEDEWSQHNAKKLIDTTGRGLRSCIPRNFPYFHIEFGLHSGYVHVIDDEKDFGSDFGRNVVTGMLKVESCRRRKQHSCEQQTKAVVEFRQAWDPFDWTKMLD